MTAAFAMVVFMVLLVSIMYCIGIMARKDNRRYY